MFTKEDCSYEIYERLILRIKQTGRHMDYTEARNAEEFIVLRHDVEFSIDRAYKMAIVEAKNGLKSSYFIQITNNAYNAISKKNIDLLKQMHAMGHKIGLHYHRNGLIDVTQIKKEIATQAQILSSFLDIDVDRFSFHRPAIEHLKANIQVENMINTYDPTFFTYADDTSCIPDSAVRYISDSNHQWKYGIPTEEYFSIHPKIQILVHPLSWSEQGANHLNCFREILNEKKEEFIQTIKNEWKIFHMLEGKL